MDFILLLSFFALFVSLILLWWAGSLSVNYSVRMADIFNLNSLFIGFVLISISTGFPELSISISSLFKGALDVSAGDILGSNVCDISLVLGLAIVLYGSLKICKKEARDSLILLLITSLSMSVIFFLGHLNWFLGLILIIVYFITIFGLWFTSTKKEILREEKIQEKIKREGMKLEIKIGRGQRQKPGRIAKKDKIAVITKLIGSILLVLVSSELAVRFAVLITTSINFSLKTIGATIFAIGTSLPELSLSLNAMKKKQYSLALGNSLGSVFEQGTLLIGILSFMSGNGVDVSGLRSLVPYMFLPFIIIGFSIVKKKKIGRAESVLMLISFFIYLVHHIFWIR